MKIIIESPHFTVNEQLQHYVIKKVSKLAHFDERLIKSEVLLKLDNSGTDDNKVCEIRVNGDQKNLFASSRSIAFEDAITQVVHALEKQLRKQKVSARRDGKTIEINNDLNQNEAD
jgi:putative sigma-54 modulation protein